MSNLKTMSLFATGAFGAGLAVALFARRLPLRGWVGVVLLMLAALFFSLTETGDDSGASGLAMMYCFFFLAPVAVMYSFRARRAPDRLLARSGFIGSFIVGAFLLWMLLGVAYAFFLLAHHKPA
jgi:hypothetical protein